MTLAELIAGFRTETDDLEPPYLWSDEEIAGYLTDAESEACIRAGVLADVLTVPMAGQRIARLPVGILEVYAVMLATGERLHHDWRALHEPGIGGRLRFYAIMGGRLYLNVAPGVDDVISVRVSRLPAEPFSPARLTAEPEIPVSEHLRLLDWALFRAYSKRDADSTDRDRVMKHAALFEQNFGPRPSAHARRQFAESGSGRVRFTPF